MKKPYSIKAREFGRGPAHVARFATLSAASQYIRDRWQGPEYIDGAASFHTDYCTYTLCGFALADIGKVSWHGIEDGFPYREFAFHNDPDSEAIAAKQAPKPEPGEYIDLMREPKPEDDCPF